MEGLYTVKRKMGRVMEVIRAEGDDGGEAENGVRDTNTRDTGHL